MDKEKTDFIKDLNELFLEIMEVTLDTGIRTQAHLELNPLDFYKVATRFAIEELENITYCQMKKWNKI
jgi:hypothetical protein